MLYLKALVPKVDCSHPPGGLSSRWRMQIHLLLNALLLPHLTQAWGDWPTNATPPFAASWRMNDSTLLYWRNASGYQDSATLKQYALVMLDWAHAAKLWINAYHPMNTGAVLAEQCRRLKRVHPTGKCVVYRNTVKAMNQYADVSALIDDPAYAGFFLHWKPGATYQSEHCDLKTSGGPPLMPNPQIGCRNLTASDVHVPMCDGANRSKCSPCLYFGTHQIPIVPGNNWQNTSHPFQNLSCSIAAGGQCDCGESPCGEYLFDYRNQSLREWFVDTFMKKALADSNVDGLVLDDSWSTGFPSEEEKHCILDTGLSPADVRAITQGWESARNKLGALAAARGSYIAPTYGGDSLVKRIGGSASKCVERMRFFCRPDAPVAAPHYFSVLYEKVPSPTFGLVPINMDLDMAYFLLARGPYGWIGSGPILGWQLSHWWTKGKVRLIEPKDFRPHWFDADFGVPVGGEGEEEQCEETVPGKSGVFVRNWTKAVVTVDCGQLQGDIRML